MQRWSLLVCALLIALPALGDGAVYKWVDNNGQIHITTEPPPKGAKRPPPPARKRSYVYQWKDKGGRFHITTTRPPEGGQLLEKIENVPKPAGAAPAETSPIGTRAVGLDRAPNNGANVQTLRTKKAVGARAPDIDGYNGLGDAVSTAELRGRPVWIAFATHFCGHCAEQAKVMAQLDGEIDDAALLVVLGVDGDIDTARKWAERYGLDPSQVVAGTPEVFPMGPVPHNVFIDRLGRVTAVRTGSMSPGHVRQELERLR